MPKQPSKAAAMPPPPRAVAPPQAPQGRRLAGNLGPGTLYPGVGKLVQRTGQPYYCGTITGRVFGFLEHPNSRDPKRTSTRFAGNFMLIDHNGTVINGHECYLPGTVERAVKAALNLNPHGEPVPLATEIWCEPDQDGRPPSPLGYSYITYDRAAVRENDPLLALAYEAGILERPSLAIAARDDEAREGETVDPETGEITRQAAEAA